MNLLFVCDKNSWRSRTAENIFGRLLPHQARSAGTNMGARAIVTNELLSWADMVFVMEEKDQRALTEGFTATMFGRRIIVLDIPDRYDFMDEELILMLKTTVAPYLDEPIETTQPYRLCWQRCLIHLILDLLHGNDFNLRFVICQVAIICLGYPFTKYHLGGGWTYYD